MAIRNSIVLAVGLTVAFGPSAGIAQDFSFGESLFSRNCAVCHGAEGKGDGPVAELFAVQPSNLQMLAKENNGSFPFSEVYQSIDGRKVVRGHGESEMPIWGDLFNAEAMERAVHPGVNPDEIVQSRILALVYYLQSVQE